jgi:hypothetical protein
MARLPPWYCKSEADQGFICREMARVSKPARMTFRGRQGVDRMKRPSPQDDRGASAINAT